MLITFEERLSDSPFVERIWRSHSEQSGSFISLANSHWEMAIGELEGTLTLTLRGPETQASQAFCPPGGRWLGIRFRLDSFMPHLAASKLVNNTITLPLATSKSFWLNGSAWHFPDYENVEFFVNRLVRQGLLVHDTTIEPALQNRPPTDLSVRSLQRRFLTTTGLTHKSIQQIERARYATILLQQGLPILDTVERAGYYDQAHLTRALKHFIGLTPSQISETSSGRQQLSFLYKTNYFGEVIL
jgi:hypothetical protein